MQGMVEAQGSGAVHCLSPRCGKMFYLSAEDWLALDPVLGNPNGVRLRCPDCALTFTYHSGDLVETEVPVAHLPVHLEEGAQA